MNSINIYENKTLKLQNVIVRRLDLESDDQNLLGVYTFENDIELDGCNYTIYVDRNEEEETMVADVFMPVKE